MEFYTVAETARLLRVSPITIRRYIASGELEAVRVGRGVRVHREAIERFVKPLSGLTPRSPRERIDGLHPKRTINSAAQLNNLADAAQDEERLPAILENLGISVGIGRSSERTDVAQQKDEYLADATLPAQPGKRRSRRTLSRPFTREDPLWKIVGIGRSDGPNNVATNKHTYLAEAILSEFE
jgi:excisionase family DNA binding protein